MKMELKESKLPTRFIIDAGKNIRGKNESTGAEFNLKDITLGRQVLDGGFSYYKLKNLRGTRSVEILLRSPDQIERVPFSENQLERIADFIRTETELERDFDCNAFVHKVHNIPHARGVFDPDKWNVTRLEKEDGLMPTDTICISHDPTIEYGRSRITHFAIFLGNGLYLSKFGTSGRLIATTLEEMKKGFGGDFVFLVTPKEPNA